MSRCYDKKMKYLGGKVNFYCISLDANHASHTRP